MIELAAELIGDAVAERVTPPALPTYDAAASQSTFSDEPVQQIAGIPAGLGVSEAVYTVSGERAVWPLSVMCRLACDATVADRTVAVEYRHAGERFCIAGTQAAVQASNTQSFCWHPQAGDVAWPVQDTAIAPLPQQHLYPGQQLVVKVSNGQAGDTLDKVFLSARLDPLPSRHLTEEVPE